MAPRGGDTVTSQPSGGPSSDGEAPLVTPTYTAVVCPKCTSRLPLDPPRVVGDRVTCAVCRTVLTITGSPADQQLRALHEIVALRQTRAGFENVLLWVWGGGCLLVVAIIVAVAIAAAIGGGRGKAGGTGSTSAGVPASAEYKLAVINAREAVPASDPAVAEFRKLLDSIKSKCGTSDSEIADMTLTGQRMLAEKGIHEGVLELMRHLDASVPAEGAHPKFEEVVAGYVLLRARGEQ